MGSDNDPVTDQLFNANLPASASDATPLAERLRPRTLAEVIGQQHLLGDGKPLAGAEVLLSKS